MKSENRSNFYLINKPKTWTSQDLCSKFKYLYRFNKVGHAGTLDPNAEGLMLLATDKYTKFLTTQKKPIKHIKYLHYLGILPILLILTLKLLKMKILILVILHLKLNPL